MNECLDKNLHMEARAPLSTYRLQMHHTFTLADGEAILPYLAKMGIGDVYSSPLFEARPGSMHGYDITRHDRFNPELGGGEGFERFCAELRRLGLGLLLDIVPNHMGVGNDSVWWQDVLENGHASKYSEYFDIDWEPLKAAMRDKLLLPILANQYGVELESKRLRVACEAGKLRIKYYDHGMPLAPRTLPIVFPEEKDAEYGLPASFRSLLARLEQVPPHETRDEVLRDRRREQLLELQPRLAEALRSPEVQPALAKALEEINGVEGQPASFDRLHRLLEAQPYRLALWRTSAEEINYRRFFDINDLVGLRMENPEVFAETHCLIRSLIASGKVTGLRIDHCDGMFNPRQYLIRLQLLYLAGCCRGEKPQGETAANGIERDILEELRGYDWSGSRGPLYTVVEKILEPREYLPAAWPVSGTSGYDFIYLANGVFIRGDNEPQFNALYNHLLGHPADPIQIVHQSKLQVMQTSLASEVHVLGNLLSRIAAGNRYARDFTDAILETALKHTIASFPVYRTYFDDRGQYSDRDVAFIRYAIARAKRFNPDVDASVFDFLRETLLLRVSAPLTQGGAGRQSPEPDPELLYFALKFQQLTGPVMAKGVEDTAFYVYNRFLSVNEVGGSIRSFGISLDTLHQGNRERLEHSPDSMLGTSTHDTKRSEDVRNRLNVLSEIPRQWASAVHRWRRMNAPFKRTMEDGRIAPDNNEEYLLYQTIVGAWPWGTAGSNREDFLNRIKQYAAKALSEAKFNLSWINPDPAYVEAVDLFVTSILGTNNEQPSAFVRSLSGLMPKLRLFGAVNSLAQLTLKIASPGVPDFYQGTEMWDLSLVDPDNRRPVDYDLRSRSLDQLIALAQSDGAAAVCREVLATLPDGRIKLWTMHRALQLRKKEPALFRRGAYRPLAASSPLEEHVIAFERRDEETGRAVIAALPRFSCTLMHAKPELPLGRAWGAGRLLVPEAGSYRNVFTDETLSTGEDGALALSAIFASFPAALLMREKTSSSG